MIKALTVGENGFLLCLGLSEGNIERIKAGQPILVDLGRLGLPPGKVAILYGETEEKIMQDLKPFIGPETQVVTEEKGDKENKTVEVHNVWAIYGMNPDGTRAEQPLAMLSRPQDWGDPRWVYNRFRFDWITEEKHYINHCHCWTDLQLKRHEYPSLFASLLTQILMPGTQEQLCGREYLREDDFWSKEWGKQPPFFEEEDSEWF